MKITVVRNQPLEIALHKQFSSLQKTLFLRYGSSSPLKPNLQVRNVTQTSVVLCWDTLEVGSADIHSLILYRNDVKAGVVPHASDIRTTKVSGLAVDADYTFTLKLRTSAGTLTSNEMLVRTHKITDLTGLRICVAGLAENKLVGISKVAAQIGAKIFEEVNVETTHCITEVGNHPVVRKASELNIPIVSSDWIHACYQEGRVVGVKNFYPT
ncbi:MAG: fibronectin type III domain-containing protein [Paenibacillus sp.]|uniref:fibronectin type III domain-containing protein n=1 Tax=Paenibacillus sp. TaxID=58172 RepID=UPI003B7D3EC0